MNGAGPAGLSVATLPHSPIRVGLLDYHPEDGRLLNAAGEDVFLRAQSAHVLQVLCDNRGKLVGKDHIIARVWPDVSVTDDSLTQCIADIRRAIGDKQREVLRTVAKRGYVLQASPGRPVMIAKPKPGENSVTERLGGEIDRALEGLNQGPLPETAPSVESGDDVLPTIAVIPFRARHAAAELDVVGEVVADDIISILSRSNEANVTSRLSTTVFRSQDAPLVEIGKALNADFVLSGSLVGDAGRVVVSLEFAEVRSSRVIWSDRVEERVSSLIGEAETALRVVSKIRKAVMLSELQRVKIHPLGSLRSYTMLMAAVGLMHRLSRPDFKAAGALLSSLIERSPNRVAPLAWMARWHVLRVQQGWSDSPQQDADAALACSGRALDIDPDNALALTNEGFVLTNLHRRLDAAEDRYNAALANNPSDASGRLLRGTLYAFQGKGDRAVKDTERALHLAPHDPHRFFYLALAASARLAAEDYGRAVELADASLRLNDAHTSTLRIKAVAQMRLGQEKQAGATARKLLRLQPNLRVGSWLRSSPSGEYDVGRRFAETLRAVGIPD